MISKEHKYIFVHIPKNAGTSIKGELKSFTKDKPLYEDWHYSLAQLIEKVEEDHAHYYKFAFTRNPYDRFASSFVYNVLRLKASDQEHWEKYGSAYRIIEKYICGDIVKSFRDFVNSPDFEKIFQIGFPVHFRPQTFFLSFGDCQFDFIGKVENIEKDMSRVLQALGVNRESKIKRLNVSKSAGYIQFYTKKTKELVAQKYATDFDSLGYKP